MRESAKTENLARRSSLVKGVAILLLLTLVFALAACHFSKDTVFPGQPDSLPTPSEGTSPSPSSGPSITPAPTIAPSPQDVTPTPPPDESEGEPPGSAGDDPLGAPEGDIYGDIPENVTASHDFLGLRDQLAAVIDAYGQIEPSIDVAVAVTDLQTGQTISVNGNLAQRAACTINMFALVAAASQMQDGLANPADLAYSIRIGIGASYPPQVKRLLELAFDDYYQGLARTREIMTGLGMKASVFDHVPYYGDGTRNNLLTALETNMALAKLYANQALNPEWTAYTLARLREIKPGLNYIIPGYLPGEATVAHKIGYYWDIDGWVDNDAGIVTFRGGDGSEKAYAITYLSQKASTEYAGYSFGARLSRIVWDWFQERYSQAASSVTPPTAVATPVPVEATTTPEPTPAPTATPSQTPSPSPSPSPATATTPSATASPTPFTPSPIPTPTPISSPG